MCGIAGYVSRDRNGLPDSAVQQRILKTMISRGPDDEGQWIQPHGKAIFLHRRLAIRDLSEHGHQPMTTTDGRFTIVFDGEIYNADELRAWVPGFPFKGTSDTERILALYERYGSRMPAFLRGMYSFAIWDEERGGVFLARDPYGIKPLYIAQTPNGFWFASRVQSLLQAPGLDLSPSPAGHAGFYLWGSVPEPYTLYKGIRSLRAGHSLWLQLGHATQQEQFVSLAKSLAEASSLSEEESSNARLRCALRESIRMHFMSNVPVAVCLSGGIKSSTILGASADVFFKDELTALSLGFNGDHDAPNEETYEAAFTAQYYDVRHELRMIRKSDIVFEGDNFFRAMDQPSIGGLYPYFIARFAKEAGFKVALSGIGGDELFGRHERFRQISRSLKMVKALSLPKSFGRGFRKLCEPFLNYDALRKFSGIFEYGGSIEGAYLLQHGLFMPWELPKVLDPDLAFAGLEELASSTFETEELKKLRTFPLPLQVSYLERTRHMQSRLLRDADWASMAHSLEVRTPFVDSFLLRQLAPLLRSSRPPTQLSLTRIPRKPLPQQILNPKKAEFTIPIREWLLEGFSERPEGGLRSWARFVYKRLWDNRSP